MTFLACNCNQTMPLDGEALSAALGEAVPVHTALCRREVGSYLKALDGTDDVIVGCTQERALFAEIAEARDKPAVAPIRFVNLRETGGWSADARRAPARLQPKVAAQLAVARLPDAEPVPVVNYRSDGALLVIGPADVALDWADRIERLHGGQLRPAVLITGVGAAAAGGAALGERRYPVWSGKVERLHGFLGAFEVEWTQQNPIDLDVCTRCGACVAACPEQAIDLTLQIDLDRCDSRRACVQACGAIGAIDFERGAQTRSERFDLVFDLSREPLLRASQLPQGYCAPGRDPLEQALGLAELARLVGEFEKPKFFQYQERLCAHGRNGQTGCSACIDVCSTAAISSTFIDGKGRVSVNPNLCMGCGACATVCPSGAMRYAYPQAPDTGLRLKTLLKTYTAAGGAEAVVLLHNREAGRALIGQLGRASQLGARAEASGGGVSGAVRRAASAVPGLAALVKPQAPQPDGNAAPAGVPARVLPFELFHAASTGLDLWLAALAHGAAQVVVLLAGDEAPEYREALQRQIEVGQAILAGLGHGAERLQLLEAESVAGLDAGLGRLAPLAAIAPAASFNVAVEKRETLDFALEHLLAHAPQAPQQPIALPARAPFGAIAVDAARCTLCMSCVGACPENALRDNPEQPQLSFVERNCVQCGLCADTCPEQAITLMPRLSLAPERRQPVTLNQARPYHCIRCSKPFGTLQMIESMLGKLGSHPAFSGAATERLKMCGDCRVVDMMEKGR